MPDADAEDAVAAASAPRVRFDKWLWAARFYKTRSIAVTAIEAGQARIGDQRVKPAHVVRVGDAVTIRKQGTVWNVEVTGIAERRGNAVDAAALYRESPDSIARRTDEALQRKAAAATEPRFTGRPTKRNRRKLADFLDEA